MVSSGYSRSRKLTTGDTSSMSVPGRDAEAPIGWLLAQPEAWRDGIVNWHRARVTNGPTEAIILWSVSGGVGDVADGHVAGGRGRVLWIVSLESAMLLAA